MRKYLVCFDYGSGGIWRVIIADSESQIREKYPELDIFEDKPDWMTDKMYRGFVNSPISISDSNNGFFNAIVSNR